MGLGTVFLSHYRRHPGQLAGLLLILICAAMLWSGVRSLTGAAERAVINSREMLEPLLSVVRIDERALTVADFAQLRRAGLCATPQLEVRFAAVADGSGGVTEPPMIVGIDLFSAACLRQFSPLQEEVAPVVGELVSGFDRPLLFGSAADLEGWREWREFAQPGVREFELRETEGLPAGQILADISVAEQLAVAPGLHGHSAFEVLLPAAELERLRLPTGYRSQVRDYGVEPAPLVDAFLLSLDALGALALLVAALLVRSVYHFALEQRRRSLQILVRLGVPVARLRTALIVEVLLVALVGGSLGLWLGNLLASGMADGFQGTLQGLFSVDTWPARALGFDTWLGLVLMLALVVAWACADLLMVRGEHDRVARVGNEPISPARWSTALCLLAVSLTILIFSGKLWLIFLSALGCLIGAGLLLPELLNRLLRFLQARAERGSQTLLEWSCSEMRALCRLLSLPLTALAFAIATAIGVQAMVTGFESTFARWLDQRLQGDLYLDPGRPLSPQDQSAWHARLQGLPGVTDVLPMVRGRGLFGELPVDVLAVDPESPLLNGWRFLEGEPNPWAALARGGVLVNEQLARRQSVAVGDQLAFKLGSEHLSRAVLGIYADYGRPEGELLLPLSALPEALPGRYVAFVLGTDATRNEDWRNWPKHFPWLAGSRMRDQAELKRAASAAFDRTFKMTRLLNLLTLALAGTALALMGLVIFRLRQGSYTLLHVYGVGRRRLRGRLVAHSMLATGLLALLAIPLGIFLGWVLVARVNPAAFGWALPLHFYPGFWLQVWLVCLLIGALVGLLAGNPVRLETLKNE